MASANLRYRVNGGAVQSTSAEVASGDTIALLATSYAGWATPAARWEIVAYPPGWSAPAGWSTDAANGRYYYLANSGGSGVIPPNITIPDPATTWGKWTFRLTVNGSIVSEDLSVETLSPALGLHDLAFGEGRQFGGTRSYVGPHQENLRTVDAAALASGGFVSALAATAPIHVNASTGSVTITWAPTGDVSMSSHKLTNVTDPTSAQDAATKAYVDSVAAGLDPKPSVFVATTTSITLSGTQTVDSVSVTAGKRVLVKDQGSSANGIYLSAAGSWTRVTDLAAGASAAGAYCFVEQGTSNGDKGFVCTNNVGSDVVGTDTLAFTTFTAAASGLDSATPVLEDATTALNANGVPTRQMSSALTFGRVGAAGSSSGPIVFRRLITGGAAGTAGTAVEIPFEMPDSTSTQRQVGRIRYEWTDPTALDPHASIIFSNLGTDGEHDWLTIASDGAMRWHGGAYAHDGYRPVFDASGNVGASVIQSSEVTTALGYTPADEAVTLTGTSPITIAGDNAAHDLSTNRTIAFSVGADVPWSGHGITSIASLDNSGGAMTIGANTTGQTIGKASTTAAFAGNISVAGTATIPGAGSSSERVGASTTAAGANSTAFGNGAKADSLGAIAMGQGTQITGSATDTICIGRGITTTSAQGITIGANASNYSQAVAVGVSASAGSSGVAIGYGSGASASQSVSIGRNASGGGTNNIAIGYNSSATGSGGATESIALGAAATTGYTNCIAIGGGASCTAANQLLLGGANCSITNVFIGKGVTHATPAAVTVQPTGGSTNGVTGAAITIAGGKGGAAADAGGAVNIQTAAAGTGTTLETRMSFAASGARTDSAPQGIVIRRESGTTGTNYEDITGLAVTLPQSATTTIATFTPPTNSFTKWRVDVIAHDTADMTQTRVFGKMIIAYNDGGSLASIATVDLHTTVDAGTWATPPDLAFSISGSDILLRGTTPALDIKFTVQKSDLLASTTTA